MRKILLEYKLEEAEKKINALTSDVNRMREVVDRFMGEAGILNRFDIRISALEAAAGIVAIEKTEE